jgi:hypothetical protein
VAATIHETLVRAQGGLRLLRVDSMAPKGIVIASEFRLTGPAGFSSQAFATFGPAYAAFRREADQRATSSRAAVG